MTILLYDDGRLVIDDGNPIEGRASLDGLVACVSDPQSGDTLKFDGNQWVAGAAASGLPAVSGDDNGKVLTVVEGAWAPAAAGGGGGIMYVDVTDEGGIKRAGDTAGTIYTASGTKLIVFVVTSESNVGYLTYCPIYETYHTDGEGYAFSFTYGNNLVEIFADTADDYPSSGQNSGGN